MYMEKSNEKCVENISELNLCVAPKNSDRYAPWEQ